MEFESLINDLREQNEKTSNFQEESSIIFSNINSGISSLSLKTQKQNMLLEKFLVSQQDQNELLAQQVTESSDEQVKNLEVSLLEQTSNVTGGFLPTALEFAGFEMLARHLALSTAVNVN